MTCTSCNYHFNWSEAETVVPCSRLHLDKFWGNVCRGCSWRAKAKLIVYRVFLAIVGVPALFALALIAAVGLLASAIVVLIVPTVVFVLLALGYEPVRRLRRRRNPFVEKIEIGPVLAHGCLYLITQ
eukprot:CAMPEP_0115502944 /NCGR_PEP_ID=MMETSP0271-20121206/69213_1 /TAXON_ID=71861 /ORGANISM="Scrippsiella trochoidea, Strain CCMP3099" /LENGTH=126 /DNA_ID=CAMNT_0002932003 /DNA_START=405 /DNA_END=782 /DNA_ORIENTATION=-